MPDASELQANKEAVIKVEAWLDRMYPEFIFSETFNRRQVAWIALMWEKYGRAGEGAT